MLSVTCDVIAKELRGDSGVYATRLYKRLTLGDQADENVWPQNQVLIYNVHSIQFNNELRFIIAYKTGHHNIKSTILMQGKVHNYHKNKIFANR